ncbi:hypothetical protein HPB48_016949 [Haemaphysalis longicornis]|uniref:Uncharacterized protein n=1 Tax=Haemaphysalis longicornis TaxID=44386 RepID=A0A9J6G1C9_HAELO|nr:hypothetical protein HPB48_016949 [Haemaphysalis longicornis]
MGSQMRRVSAIASRYAEYAPRPDPSHRRPRVPVFPLLFPGPPLGQIGGNVCLQRFGERLGARSVRVDFRPVEWLSLLHDKAPYFDAKEVGVVRDKAPPLHTACQVPVPFFSPLAGRKNRIPFERTAFEHAMPLASSALKISVEDSGAALQCTTTVPTLASILLFV